MKRAITILKLLKSNDYLSGETISKRLMISREAVWKNISLLRKYGYIITAKKGQGYKLEKISELLLPWEIQDDLDTRFIGKNIIHKMSIDSTQDLALAIANKCEDGTVIIAEEQHKGRGRIGRTWYSPLGGVWFSLILKPSIEPTRVTLLPLAMGLAITDVLIRLGVDAKLKWPNDVMINNKKVAGILFDMSSEMDKINYVIVGIGINVNIDGTKIREYVKDATTLRDALKYDIDRKKFMKDLLRSIEYRYMQFINEPPKILEDYKDRCLTLNQRVTVRYFDEEFNADAINIDADGSLMVMLDNNTIRKISAGDVSIKQQ